MNGSALAVIAAVSQVVTAVMATLIVVKVY